MKDDLSKLLGNWEPSVPEPADFRGRVWRRIEVAEPPRYSLFGSWYERVIILLTMPLIAVATAILAVLAGSAAHSDNATGYVHSGDIRPPIKRGSVILLVVLCLGAAMGLLSYYFFSIAVRLPIGCERSFLSTKKSLLGQWH